MAATLDHATRFTFVPHGGYFAQDGPIEVECRDPENPQGDCWAVIKRGRLVLNHDGEWEYEPQPSSRTEEFLKRCRWDRDEAIDVAKRQAWA